MSKDSDSTMTVPGTVSFKAFLRQKGNSHPKEVRRFGMEQAEVVSFSRVKAKLQQTFPSLAGCLFSISWRDADGDDIIISSDEELLTALTESNDEVRRFYLDVNDPPSTGFQPFEIKPAFIDIPLGFGDADEAESGGDEEDADVPSDSAKQLGGCTFQPKEHSRVICDGCNHKITSHRYKCVECQDFDLCLSCESQGLHSEHIMARIPLANSFAARHPYFVKGLGSLKDAVRKIQHRRKKNERRYSKLAGASDDYLFKMASNYFMDFGKCTRDAQWHKSDKRGKRDHCQSSSAAKEAFGLASTSQAPPSTNTTIPTPSTSKSQPSSPGQCPAASGLMSSFLNKENMTVIQRFLEQICPVPEQIMQEVAKNLAKTNLDDEPASTSAPKPVSNPTNPFEASSNSAEPSAPLVSSPTPMDTVPDPLVPTVTQLPQSSGSSLASASQSPRPGSVEPDPEGWMVVDSQVNDTQNTQNIYPKLPSGVPAAVNVEQPQSVVPTPVAPQPQPQAPVIHHRDAAVKICLERLGRMGYNIDDQFIVELTEAHRGDLSRVLDMLG